MLELVLSCGIVKVGHWWWSEAMKWWLSVQLLYESLLLLLFK